MPQATLYNPNTGHRVAVGVGSTEAQEYFGQGYFLETSYNPVTGQSTFDDPTQSQPDIATDLDAEAPEIDPSQTASGLIDTLGLQSNLGDFFRQTSNTARSGLDQAILDMIARQEKDREERQTEAERQRESALAGLEEAYMGESAEDIMRRLMGEYEIQAKIDQLTGLKNQLAQLETDFQLARNAINAKPIHAAIIRGQVFLKQQEYAARASGIAAKASIVQDQLSIAQDIVSSYYDAAMIDRQNAIAYHEKLFDLAREDLITLREEERENINTSIALLKDAEAKAEAERNKIFELLSDPVMAVAFANSGANLDMSFEEIMTEMIPAIAAEETRRFDILHRPKGSGSQLKFDTPLDEDIYNQALDMVSAEQSLGRELTPEEYWNYVNKFAELNGIEDVAIAEAQLKNAMTLVKERKGLPQGGYIRDIDENLGNSEFTIGGTQINMRLQGVTGSTLRSHIVRRELNILLGRDERSRFSRFMSELNPFDDATADEKQEALRLYKQLTNKT